MQSADRPSAAHPVFSRRLALQGGAIGLLGLGINHLEALQSASQAAGRPAPKEMSVIYIFLSGGLSQHDSFDMKPAAPVEVRGEFKPISTRTPGLKICEHLPLLAARSHLWALVRSLTHPFNEHNQGHMVMLSGRSQLPPNFQNNGFALPSDWPSIVATAGSHLPATNNLPPIAILPEALRHSPGKAVAGQLAGQMGPFRDPWIIEAAPYRVKKSGAFPNYAFNHHTEQTVKDDSIFQAPSLSLPEGLDRSQFHGRLNLLDSIQQQRRQLDQLAESTDFDRYRQQAISLLADPQIQQSLDVTRVDDKSQNRYGRNSFGWSLLMARRLVEAGVRLIQVNLGNQGSWDTHGSNFIKLRDFLLPPTDRALSALLDDLHESGRLENTLIVMAGEFGRTSRIFQCCPTVYDRPGRDHWGAAQTVFFAGGGVRGGNVIGSTDRLGEYPDSHPQHPENMAATIYQAVGIPKTAHWKDEFGRPHQIYFGDPISGLMEA